MSGDWYSVTNVDEVDSPALLVYAERVRENTRRMIALIGDVKRLRPHVKTHKLPEIVRLQLSMGITKFKCATIAEGEMLADNGAPDVLLAYQPLGPKVTRLIQLITRFPATQFSTMADDSGAVRALSAAAVSAGVTIPVLVDIDCGMHRSGIPAEAGAESLYRQIASSPGLLPGGLHAYDGHINKPDPGEREKACEAAMAPAWALRDKLLAAGIAVPRFVAGGTPTFPIYARRPDLECSPGTLVFWDGMYVAQCPDMDFLLAALVLTRVVSKPGPNLLCLDLGHKAIAAENPHPRVQFLNLPDAKSLRHSEEHLVIETSHADEIPLGAVLYGVPWHICPTVALYSEATVIKEAKATEKWTIVARKR